MKKKIISIPLLLISYLCLNAQQENGTILLDNATSKTYVVTNAFLNASNDVHDLIQNVSPTPDFTTNNQTLVDTIVDIANVPDLSDYELKSELTNDVCEIVTNDVPWWTFSPPSIMINGELRQIYVEQDDIDGNWYVYGGEEYPLGAVLIPGESSVFRSISDDGEIEITAMWAPRNALCLARLSDIAPTITNTVTKSYIESLGIETGISASTASNISYSVTTNYVYNELTNRPTRAEMDDGWWGEWKVSGIGDYIFVSITYHDNSMVGGTKYWVLAYIIPNDGPYEAECDGDENSTTLTFSVRDKLVTATRHRVASPIPTKVSEISNDVGFVTSSITNGLATESITNGFVTESITNDVPSTVSNTVTKSYVESLGISGVETAEKLYNSGKTESYDASQILDLAAQTTTNISWHLIGLFSASGTVAYASFAVSADNSTFSQYANKANMLSNKDKTVYYDADDLLEEASRLAATNTEQSIYEYSQSVNIQIENKIGESLENYVTFPDLDNYVTFDNLESYTTFEDVTNITQDAIGDFAETGTVENANYASFADDAQVAVNARHIISTNELHIYTVDDIFYEATNIAGGAVSDFSTTGSVKKVQIFDTVLSTYYEPTTISIDGITDWMSIDIPSYATFYYPNSNQTEIIASNAVASADTSYTRFVGLTNLNQTVQYISVTDQNPSTLQILIPTNGVTKDWIVYVSAVTNVTLRLPAATWWMADTAYTNDVPPATPTAFYFSQIFSEGTTNVFYLGRQELMPVTITTEE